MKNAKEDCEMKDVKDIKIFLKQKKTKDEKRLKKDIKILLKKKKKKRAVRIFLKKIEETS